MREYTKEACPRGPDKHLSELQNEELWARSGKVRLEGDRLVSFLYDLMRDYVPANVVEKLVRDAHPNIRYTNGFLAQYAKDLAERLRTIDERVQVPAATQEKG